MFKPLRQGNQTEGHLRLFRALRDLVDRKRFEIVRATPTITWNFLLDQIVFRFPQSPYSVVVLVRA
jgi:hypothetical protein